MMLTPRTYRKNLENRNATLLRAQNKSGTGWKNMHEGPQLKE